MIGSTSVAATATSAAAKTEPRDARISAQVKPNPCFSGNISSSARLAHAVLTDLDVAGELLLEARIGFDRDALPLERCIHPSDPFGPDVAGCFFTCDDSPLDCPLLFDCEDPGGKNTYTCLPTS